MVHLPLPQHPYFSSPFGGQVGFAFDQALREREGLLPQELPYLSQAASHKRVAEFTLGRVLARRALQGLVGDAALSWPILRQAKGRGPSWPAGYVGAITHSMGWGAAAVASQTQYRSLGLDLELIHPPSLALVNRILTPEEKRWLAAQRVTDVALILVFSAKESLYKALNPLGAVNLGFLTAEVDFGPEWKRPGPEIWGSFGWRLTRFAGEGFPEGFSGQGVYAVSQGFVLTGVLLEQSPLQAKHI